MGSPGGGAFSRDEGRRGPSFGQKDGEQSRRGNRCRLQRDSVLPPQATSRNRPAFGRYRRVGTVKIGNILIVVGIGIVVVGLLVRIGWFSWFGNLPGDIKADGDRGGFSFPITSSIIVSIAATLLLNLALRLFRDR